MVTQTLDHQSVVAMAHRHSLAVAGEGEEDVVVPGVPSLGT
jgi:hypothetical protein